MVNQDSYLKMLDERLKDAEFNLKHAEKKYKEAQQVYETILSNKKQFELLSHKEE